MNTVDVVLGLQYGDEGKGKVCHNLIQTRNYTHVLRFNGGGNAGHTIYHNGVKYVTHLIPSGVFFGVKSIIGAGCVVNISKFFEEISYLENNGFNTKGVVFIDKRCHIVTDDHVSEDSQDVKIGTTKSGNGPAYRDKYSRKGLRAESFPELKSYLIDSYVEFHESLEGNYVLAEGAQAFGLDIDWGDYPYVTSSHCGVGAVLQNGFSHKDINDVFGIMKAYETYVGSKIFQPADDVFVKIQKAGQEFGATTGRMRQCNWTNLDLVKKSIKLFGVNHVVVNKSDILNEVGEWGLISNNKVKSFGSEQEFKIYLDVFFDSLGVLKYYSDNPFEVRGLI